jgi:predicted DNA-binding transcriptional regulator
LECAETGGIALKFWLLIIFITGMSSISEDESNDVLKGTALDIYKLMLKSSKPFGIREIQRTLGLSSPSVAEYHLSKLEAAGLVKRESGKFVIDKLILQNFIKINRFLIPRYLFYVAFAASILAIELIFLRPDPVTRDFIFYLSITLVFVIIFAYETAKAWLKGSL